MWLALFVACTKSGPAPPVADVARLDPCFADCTRARMPEAMEWSVIEQECRAACEAQEATWTIVSATVTTAALDHVAAWFQETLGFTVRDTGDAPHTVALERPGISLQLVHDSAAPPAEWVFQVHDLTAVQEHLERQLLPPRIQQGTFENRPAVLLQTPAGGTVRLVGP